MYQLDFGYRKVYLPEREEALWLLVVHGFGKEPMMLLTTEPLRKNRKVLWRIIESYIRRWTIEETIRFIKQSYEVEDVRVLGYRSLQNLMPLVLAAGYVLRAAKRLFGIPDFHYYAIADGLTSIFIRYPGRIIFAPPRISDQMIMFIGGT